jgi:serine/threonine protein kinase
MSSVRDRLNKNLPSLSVSTGKNHDSQSTIKTIRSIEEAEFAKKYQLGEQVMESCHAGMSIRFAERLSDNLKVVIKVRVKAVSFKKNKGSEELEWRGTMEMQLNMPKSEVICELMEVIETEKNYYVVMEKVEGKDLFETMSQESILHGDAREIVKQILVALQSMHEAGRIHKDLKLENVMVDMDQSVSRRSTSRKGTATSVRSPISPVSAKLIDFDTVENWEPNSPKAKDVLGTDGYIAPEAYLGAYSPASDMYCVGVITYKLLTKRFPSRREMFDDKPGENYVGSPAMGRIHERLKATPMDFTRSPFDACPAASDFVAALLSFDPDKRLTAGQALAHDWFSIPDDKLPERVRSQSS